MENPFNILKNFKQFYVNYTWALSSRASDFSQIDKWAGGLLVPPNGVKLEFLLHTIKADAEHIN
jgi:hypothetical protein